jgi:signal transduction histidine kinase
MTRLASRVSAGLSLRWRVAVAFAFASLLVTGLLALITWQLASGYMYQQRQQSSTRQALADTALVAQNLKSAHPDLPRVLSSIEHNPDTTIAVRQANSWTVRGRAINPARLPAALLADAARGWPTPQRAVIDDVAVLLVAVPIPSRDALYLQTFPLSDLDQALRYLAWLLISGTAASGLLGLAIGRWASRQALRPLHQLTDTAGRIASGELRARLPEQHDTDLASLATAFNRNADALEQRVRRDAQFAGDVSHELRSPLTTMLNAVAVLNRRHTELSATAQHALRLLTADLHRFHTMVLDLLEISRDHSQPLDERDLEPCDLAELLAHAVAHSGHTAPPHLEIEPPPPVVLADRRRLDRAVANLLDNATRHGGGAIRVAAMRHGDHARLEIDDAGPGIPSELHQQIFERFTRGNHSGERAHNTGTGLGLALVAQHIRRHAGSVWVEHREEGGSRFIIELPRLQPPTP